MAGNGVLAAGGRLTDWVSLGVLAWFVPRDAVDDAIAAAGKQARRPDGKLPPHVMVYLALALFADDDYEEVAAWLTETLTSWDCWDDSWSVPGPGGITQARQRLGYEPGSAPSRVTPSRPTLLALPDSGVTWRAGRLVRAYQLVNLTAN